MRVSKRGSGLAVRLPQALVKRFGLKEGDEVELHIVDDRTLALSKAGEAMLPALPPADDGGEANER